MYVNVSAFGGLLRVVSRTRYSPTLFPTQKAKSPGMPPPPPPPPPPPKPVERSDGVSVGGAASAVFAEIRGGGEHLTSRLRHVPDAEKAYKQNIQHGAVDFSGLEAKKAAAEAKRVERTSAQSEPPTVVLEGDKRWVVKHQTGNATQPRCVKLDKVTMRQAVQIHNCEYAFVEIAGKVNSVSVVSCKKVQVAIESVVASLEVLKSESVDVKVTRAVPTASVEKSTSVNIFLMDKDEATNTEIVTACSSAVNVNFPSQEDQTDMIERPVPEQFVSRIVKDKKGGYKIETKPNEIC